MRYFFILASIVLLVSCNNDQKQTVLSPVPFKNTQTQWADSTLNTLSLEEQIGQLIVVHKEALNLSEKVQLFEDVASSKLSGVHLESFPLQQYEEISHHLANNSKLPLWGTTNQPLLLHNHFSDQTTMPKHATLAALNNDSLINQFNALRFLQADQFKINVFINDQLPDSNALVLHNEKRMLQYAPLTPLPKDSVAQLAWINEYQRLNELGLSGLWADTSVLEQLLYDSTTYYLQNKLNFNGLWVAKWSDQYAKQLINSPFTVFITDQSASWVHGQILAAVKAGVVDTTLIRQKVRNILLAKSWQNHIVQPQKEEKVQAQFASVSAALNYYDSDKDANDKHLLTEDDWEFMSHQLYEQSISLVNNPNNLLPFTYTYKRPFVVWDFGRQPMRRFKSFFHKYADAQFKQVNGQLNTVSFRKEKTHVLLLDEMKINPERDSQLIAILKSVETEHK
ncbi:MAG: hypothetical protein AAFO07_16645, partial [Bacteroidota bacterium]